MFGLASAIIGHSLMVRALENKKEMERRLEIHKQRLRQQTIKDRRRLARPVLTIIASQEQGR